MVRKERTEQVEHGKGEVMKSSIIKSHVLSPAVTKPTQPSSIAD